MIYIKVTRTAWCHVCARAWDLDQYAPIPKTCKWCGSTRWNGEPNKQQIAIRQGRAYAREPINPGAVSLKRQARAKKQTRRFKDQDGNPV